MKYKLTLTEKQMRIITSALDIVARIDNCQFDMVISSSSEYWKRKVDQDKYKEGLDKISEAFGLRDRYDNLGLSNCSIRARDAYSMHVDMRHQLWKDNEEKDRVSVCSDNCKAFEYEEPDVVIEKIEDKK